MIVCPKCGIEYSEEVPYCVNPPCLDFPITKREYPETGGILTYVQGFKYPVNGYPQIDITWINATIKRGIMSALRILANPKNLFSPLRAFVVWVGEVYISAMKQHELPFIQFSKTAKEVIRIGEILTDDIKDEVYKTRAKDTAHYFAMLLEFDTAYRYRFQDILSELSKENLIANPRKEIIRLLSIARDREVGSPEQKNKTRIILTFANILLFLSRRARNFIKKALLELDTNAIFPDMNDRYWMSRYFDYDFNGESYAVRAKWKEDEDRDFKEPENLAQLSASVSLVPNKFFFEVSRDEVKQLIQKVAVALLDRYDQGE